MIEMVTDWKTLAESQAEQIAKLQLDLWEQLHKVEALEATQKAPCPECEDLHVSESYGATCRYLLDAWYMEPEYPPKLADCPRVQNAPTSAPAESKGQGGA